MQAATKKRADFRWKSFKLKFISSLFMAYLLPPVILRMEAGFLGIRQDSVEIIMTGRFRYPALSVTDNFAFPTGDLDRVLVDVVFVDLFNLV